VTTDDLERVVVLETNRLFGGDSGYYYVGSYAGKNGLLTAQVRVTHYAGLQQSILVPVNVADLNLEEDSRNSRRVSRARGEEDIAFDVMRHKQVAHGGIFRLPVHDKDGRPFWSGWSGLVFR
jgi:hypothetical protein